MPNLYTIGYKKKSLQVFISQLRGNGIDVVVDVRLRNTSHLLGYTKRDDLAFLLQEGFGIAYDHRHELAPTAEILIAYRKAPDWEAYEAQFRPLLTERSATDIGRSILARWRKPCLLCAEPTPEHCHRRLVAEHWAQHIHDLKIIHL